MIKEESKPTQFYAHSKEGAPPSEWQPLDEHLHNVAELAAEFARPFGGEEWARLAGLWHDLGKYNPDFQKRLHGDTKHVVHSDAGAHLVTQKGWRGMEPFFSWVIMGHHAGLADYSAGVTGAKALESRMRNPERSQAVFELAPRKILDQVPPTLPKMFSKGETPPDQAFFIRMLFSCLVDADFLDTEAFMNSSRSNTRKKRYPTLEELLSAFDIHMSHFDGASGLVNEERARVLARCRKMAEQTGVFSLTVPTGGGKTLASLAFALRHAVEQGKRRIIYVIPYTSIIEQTANVFRSISGFEDAVLEHHCNLVFDDKDEEAQLTARLAMENWDAPIVVTTNVQFFESLYANRTSRCRKLHNISDSVVIFDEAQCIPPAFLRPCVFAIRELSRNYGVTPLLCTATQPVLDACESFDFAFKEGFELVTEIIENPLKLFDSLERVRVETLNDLSPMEVPQLAKMISEEATAVLCIVNRKDDARELALLLPAEHTVHLSTNLCAAHRLQVLEDIRNRLQSGEPICVVSTSLVEAGVDLDFPVVYRALAGLDSIAQAAGRCNREGMLAFGRTVIFLPEKQPDYVKSAASLAQTFLQPDRLPRLFKPLTFKAYFQQYFFMKGTDELDKNGIRDLLPNQTTAICFQTAAEKFRLVDDDWQVPVIMPYKDASVLVDQLLEERWNAISICRKLQRYSVSVPKRIADKLINEEYALPIEGYNGLIFMHVVSLYHKNFGFIKPDEVGKFEMELMNV